MTSRPAYHRPCPRPIHLNHSNPALDPESPERRAIEEAGFRVAADGEEIPL